MAEFWFWAFWLMFVLYLYNSYLCRNAQRLCLKAQDGLIEELRRQASLATPAAREGGGR